MAVARGEFSSKIGFILAAAGSAVGLGNIWGFPTNTAMNGGAAFVFVYLILAFCLAYPALMAELIIGRHAKSNAVAALSGESTKVPAARPFGFLVGITGIITAILILSFYGIVAGWMISYMIEPIAKMAGAPKAAEWLTDTSSTARNVFFTVLFMVATVYIIIGGVKNGIEKWSTRLMPLLIGLLVVLIIYVAMQDGAAEGFKKYLLPDFSRVTDPELLVDALGQAFFSLSLGVGTMLVYGSYIQRNENLVKLGTMVTLIDVGIAFIAGLLVIPAMYVAQAQGVQIFAEDGVTLLKEDTLIFQVLPQLFNTMGATGLVVGCAFFFLMSIAALTSSISLLEVPVAYAVESLKQDRKKSTIAIGSLILAVSIVIILNFGMLFGFVITLTTKYAQPLLGLCFCVFAGWLWHRNDILNEVKEGHPDAENSMFWKIWPWYVKFLCPLFIAAFFAKSVI